MSHRGVKQARVGRCSRVVGGASRGSCGRLGRPLRRRAAGGTPFALPAATPTRARIGCTSGRPRGPRLTARRPATAYASPSLDVSVYCKRRTEDAAMARPVRPRLQHFGLVPVLRWSQFVATGQSECFARLGVWARADPPPALRPAPLSCVCVRVPACVCACACVLVGSCACVRARPRQAVAADPFAIEQCPIGFRFHAVTDTTSSVCQRQTVCDYGPTPARHSARVASKLLATQ